ncbi:hypothetical protein CN680_22580 [Bacillus pseudomycoides]|uniref:Uncharacterized protein n=1 Tax=Bacillus pseudomycoides TaxID=64104 RepID=A0ABD6SXI1_9BACI|nr:hypothetical protein [Bacillus pseudomycoides]MED4654956.1 hypothetical protein [Bacillus pseudomycoides]PDZ11706.1 hypothetical protein CON70_10105 [Bacillus pseudomycoides]PEE02608.1 hypothetical protein CON86_30300 [Bacillus pseudomycoides]PEI34054.1 hypothetical protein CN620_26705 [Bacillus pseudomycoides]PEJ71720.1 hypothetical protein CN680_22580 [Bacillus pseudomycoides]
MQRSTFGLIKSFTTLFSIFLLVQNGILMFLDYWNGREVFQSKVIMFAVGILLLGISIFLHKFKNIPLKNSN